MDPRTRELRQIKGKYDELLMRVKELDNAYWILASRVTKIEESKPKKVIKKAAVEG